MDPCTGNPCNDGLYCNGTETCAVEGGQAVCGDGDPVECPEGEVCDEETDACVVPVDPCEALDCDDGDLCTDDSCADAACVYTAVDCDDGLFCTGAETCDSATGCVAGEDPCDPVTQTCDDDNDVCVDLCVTADECDDVDVCTDDACVNNACVNTAIVCDDADLCTDDTCDAVTGCVYTAVVCDAGFECDPLTGDCVEVPACEGDEDCDDNLFCNGLETCDEDGNCIAGTDPCADLNCTCQGEDQDPVCEEGDTAAVCSCQECPSIEFTLGQDNLPGSTGDDVYLAPLEYSPAAGAQVATLQTGDAANGLAGTDTLNATFSAALANAVVPTLSGIEVLNLTDFGANISTLNATNISGVTDINAVNNTTFVNVVALANIVNLGITNSAVGVGATFLTAATSGPTDDLTFTLDGCQTGSQAFATTTVANGFESFSVVSTGNAPNEMANLLQVTGSGLTTLNFSGAQNLKLNVIPDDNGPAPGTANPGLVTIAGSGMTGNLQLGTGTTVAGATAYTSFATQDWNSISSGGGDDTFIFAGTLNTNDFNGTGESIDGGAGTDILQASLGANLTTAMDILNIEELRLNATGANYSMNLTDANGIETITFEADAASNILTLNNVKNTQAVHTLNFRGDGLNVANEVYDGVTYVAGDVSGGGHTLNIGVGNRGVALTTDTYSHQIGSAVVANGFETVTITVADGDATFSNCGSTELQTLTLTASGDLTLGNVTGGDVPAVNESVQNVNASGVAGDLSATFPDVGDFASVTLGPGRDIVSIAGSGGNNPSIYAGAANDQITGSAQADFIYGEAGDDTLTGGAGADTLSGDTGDDLFVFGAVGTDMAGDTITDFRVSGSDTIRLAAGLTVAATAAFTTVADLTAITTGLICRSTANRTTAQIAADVTAGAQANAVVLVFDSTKGYVVLVHDTDWVDIANRSVVDLSGVADATMKAWADGVVFSQ